MPKYRPLRNYTMIPYMTADQIRRFWNFVDSSSGADTCWPWIGTRHGGGYGQFSISWWIFKSHRISHWLCTGEQPIVVMHKCDYPPCCNPSHLSSGTYKLNSQDSVKKGRNITPNLCGEKAWNHKLTNEQIKEIRDRRAAGEKLKSIAADFGVYFTTISRIATGSRWGHLK
jgi:hypothetical protein